MEKGKMETGRVEETLRNLYGNVNVKVKFRRDCVFQMGREYGYKKDCVYVLPAVFAKFLFNKGYVDVIEILQ